MNWEWLQREIKGEERRQEWDKGGILGRGAKEGDTEGKKDCQEDTVSWKSREEKEGEKNDKRNYNHFVMEKIKTQRKNLLPIGKKHQSKV